MEPVFSPFYCLNHMKVTIIYRSLPISYIDHYQFHARKLGLQNLIYLLISKISFCFYVTSKLLRNDKSWWKKTRSVHGMTLNCFWWWGRVWNTHSLPLLPGSGMFQNYSYLIGLCVKKISKTTFNSQLNKKCIYEHTINAIP